ncbi:group 3 secretory phospholipase A2-like [Parambassis ranga]|uniref:phospholipase A2 n=1 Tax=Parambassis ranga TaxID=210632 RepID=A0A6P7IZA1_9TELE|nr:group 3 secretory phospholipase A2-like [Parambassis ranga]
MKKRCLLQVAFVLSSFTLSKAQDVVGPGLSCVRLIHLADGQMRVTFMHEDAAGVRSSYLTVWSQDMRLLACEVNPSPLLTEGYRSLCNGSDTRDQEIIQRFNISALLAPCVRVSSSAPKFARRTRRDWTEKKSRRKRAWIFPGTLWCGSGNKAIGYEQLGMFESADRCCREHDHCLHIIPAFTVKYGVLNPNFYTVSHCECDQRFRQCLLFANESVSSMVGYSFFNILRIPCFELEQQKQCTEMYWWGMCKVAKKAPYAVFKSPLPYSNASTDQYLDTDSHYVTKSPVIHPHRKSTKSKHRCPFRDPPRGDTFHHTRTKGRGCKRHQTPPQMLPRSSTPERGDTFQPHCKSCLEEATASHMATTSTSGIPIPKTTETSFTPTVRITASPPKDGKQQKEVESMSQSIHAQRRQRQNSALHNMTDIQLHCGSLKHLDECKFKIPPMEKKYDLQNTESKTVYHCDCTHRLALQIESFKQRWILLSLLVDFVSRQCFILPKKKKCIRKERFCRGFTKASDLHQALKKTEEKDITGVQTSGITRKKGIPVRLYKRCLQLQKAGKGS